MAFIGIGVFWVSLPTLPIDAKLTIVSYLPLAIRPIGMLLFVEAIAWFLLRQYRALIEDYKSFNRVYLRRVNLLAALKIATESVSYPRPVVTALLTDNVTGRLGRGETTEWADAMRHIGANPADQLLELLTAVATKNIVPRQSKRQKATSSE
jgi:hypothetical protein